MGGNERTGRWRVAERCNVVNVMGGSELDLCDAELSDQVTEINVYTLMGGFEIRVPDGVDVQVSKFALHGRPRGRARQRARRRPARRSSSGSGLIAGAAARQP